MRSSKDPRPFLRQPVTTQTAYANGITRDVLRGPQFRQLFAGVHVRTEIEPTEQVLVEAALSVLPVPTVVTGVTALRLHGIEVGPAQPLYFVTTHPHPVRRSGVVVSRTAELPAHQGLLVTPEHAFTSAATRLNLLELVTAGDWLVRLRRCQLSSLTAYATNFSGRGAVRARRAAALVRERVDSPRETRLRLALVLAGLPHPQCNPLLGTEDRPIGRVDLAYQRYRVIIEYEGDQHRRDARQWNTDIGRHEDFTTAGLTLIRVTALRMRRPRDVVRRVFDALSAAGYPGPEPTFDQEWRALFESTR